jgi:hypothetical protein
MTSPTELPADPSGRPFDQGLQPERTALAWRRTSLSLTVGALVAARVLPHFWGAPGLLIAGAGVIASVAIIVLAHRRYRTHHHRLTSGHFEHLGLPDGALPALLAGTALAAGIIGIALTATL